MCIRDSLNSLIRNGSEVARPLQRSLRNIMWEYGGVVKNEEKLKKGLDEIKSLKSASADLDVRPDSEGYQDLMLAFDLEASIISSEVASGDTTEILSLTDPENSNGSCGTIPICLLTE